MITVLSLFLGLLSCGVTFALYKRRKWAPRLMIMVQVPFTVYDLATRQYGFILISVATILTAIIAHHERHEIDPRLAKAVHEKAHRIRAEDDLEHHEAVWVAAESLGVSRPEFSRISYLPGELSSAAMRAVSWSSYIPPVLSTWSRRFSQEVRAMAKAAVAIAITVLALACCACASKHYADPSCAAVLGQLSTVPPDARQAVRELASRLRRRKREGSHPESRVVGVHGGTEGTAQARAPAGDYAHLRPTQWCYRSHCPWGRYIRYSSFRKIAAAARVSPRVGG